MKAMLITALAGLTVLLYVPIAASQTGYFVDAAQGDDGNPGTSWSAPKATIGAALQLTADGDTVYVAEGHYLERLTLPLNVILLGGFPSGGGSRDPQTHETIIDGQQQGSVITTRLHSNDVIDGFTITGGSASQGGGINALGSSQFRNLKIINNQASNMGGGIFCGESVTVENCQILNNQAAIAPGMAIVGSSSPRYTITVRKNVIRHNLTTSQGFSGGAVLVTLHLDLDFSYNLVADNTAPDGGVMIEETFGQKTLDHNTIARNGERGLTIELAFTVVVSNSIIYGHTTADVDMKEDTLSHPTLRYSDIGTIHGPRQEEQLISLDPQFVDADNGDYTLRSTSPCIDSGDPAAPPDADGTVTDMGAFPFSQNPVKVPSTAPKPPTSFALEPVYPNPFSRSANVTLLVTKAGPVRIVVYDILGRQVRRLTNRWFSPGRHGVNWDGRDDQGRTVAPGIYHIVAVSGKTRAVNRVVRLRSAR